MAQLADTLIVIDLQNALQDCYDFNNLIEKTNLRIQSYRKENRPIIFIQHHDQDLIKGSEDWQLFDGLDFKKSDLFSEKAHANAFYHTDLQQILQRHNLQTLEICGAQTNYCCNATIIMAHGLGYKITMGHNMTTTTDNDYLDATSTISFFENIWDHRFLSFVE